jgi:type IV secretory pathway ATPase VirB11/archaellum biosynthesis ATPase
MPARCAASFRHLFVLLYRRAVFWLLLFLVTQFSVMLTVHMSRRNAIVHSFNACKLQLPSDVLKNEDVLKTRFALKNEKMRKFSRVNDVTLQSVTPKYFNLILGNVLPLFLSVTTM